MSRKKIDHERIKAEVRAFTQGGRVWKVMACGHREYVYISVDERTRVCWACALSQRPATQHGGA